MFVTIFLILGGFVPSPLPSCTPGNSSPTSLTRGESFWILDFHWKSKSPITENGQKKHFVPKNVKCSETYEKTIFIFFAIYIFCEMVYFVLKILRKQTTISPEKILWNFFLVIRSKFAPEDFKKIEKNRQKKFHHISEQKKNLGKKSSNFFLC